MAWEALKAQLSYSQIDKDEQVVASSRRVTLRHLALLAQIRAIDQDVWESLNRSQLIDNVDEPPTELVQRLSMMRAWIDSPHFPEDFRLTIQSEVSEHSIKHLDSRDIDYLKDLKKGMSDCYWVASDINHTICELAKARELKLRDAFEMLYWIVLGQSHGPKLASVLEEMNKQDLLNLLDSAISNI